MKTPLFFLAALVAFFALPLDFTTTVSVLFVAGLAAIAITDYRRQRRVHSIIGARYAPMSSPERLQLAA